MDLQKVLLSKPKLARKLLETAPPKLLLNLGKKKAFKAFKSCLNVKAYKELLKQKKIDISKIKSVKDFDKLPIIDKQNYILNNPLKDIIKYDFPQNYTIEESSGYGGKSCFWLRFSGQDDSFVNYMEVGLSKTFKIDKKTTLLINTFALGTWVTGVKFARAACGVANKADNKMTVANTGMIKKSVMRILENFSKYYEQTILVGYPPFVKEIVEEANELKLLKGIKLNIMVGAEAFPEEWREYINSILINNTKYTPIILSAYGAADVGLELGYEQPITVMFRNLLRDNKDIRYEILGNGVDFVPHFFQYNPLNIWIEEYNNELIYTSNSGIPVTRYNLHDSGGIIEYDKMIEVLSRKFDIKKILKDLKPFKLPLLYLRGRTDGVIPVSGANVYIEQVRSALENKLLQKYITGRFYSYSELDKNFFPLFHIIIEIDDNKVLDEKKKEYINKKIVKTLCKLNQDYNAFYQDKPEQYRPITKFINRTEFNKYINDSIKIKYIKKD